jgi:hypothetical protein
MGFIKMLKTAIVHSSARRHKIAAVSPIRRRNGIAVFITIPEDTTAARITELQITTGIN